MEEQVVLTVKVRKCPSLLGVKKRIYRRARGGLGIREPINNRFKKPNFLKAEP
jgi:hypothetical protein